VIGRAPAAAVALVCAITWGCGGMQQRTETLTDAIQTYNDGVRWQRYSAAATKLMPAERDAFLDERDQLSADLRITDYDIIRVSADKDASRATVQIKYTWFLDSVGTVHETNALQDWERHGKVWIMAAERRLRGEEMPGLPEPAPEAETDSDSPAPPDASPDASPDGPAPAPGADLK
jgi:hypothetical protein